MGDRYIAFDVETPNCANNRMSAIGVSVIENGEITEEFYSLVNPEAHFDWFNIELTGITPEMAAGAPTFPELWDELEPLMDSGLLVAHNAPFDMSVLAKCLRDYGIRWHSSVDYACTCQMGRRLLPGLPNHKLNTLCEYCVNIWNWIWTITTRAATAAPAARFCFIICVQGQTLLRLSGPTICAQFVPCQRRAGRILYEIRQGHQGNVSRPPEPLHRPCTNQR